MSDDVAAPPLGARARHDRRELQQGKREARGEGEKNRGKLYPLAVSA